jgi:UDP-glucuronate decarboxylase
MPGTAPARYRACRRRRQGDRRKPCRAPLVRARVLVTGGAGFLGSHLCARLLAEGADVLCVDSFFTGRRDNIAGMIGHPRFELLPHDITFPLHVEVDEIYNLA